MKEKLQCRYQGEARRPRLKLDKIHRQNVGHALLTGVDAMENDLVVPVGDADFVVEDRRKQGSNTWTLGIWRRNEGGESRT
jgi:hypothetical protein